MSQSHNGGLSVTDAVADESRRNGHESDADVSDTSVKTGAESLSELEAELLAELRKEREARKQLEERVEQLEAAIDVRGSDSDVKLEDVWIGNAPAGKLLKNTKRRATRTSVAVFGRDSDLPSSREIQESAPLVDAVEDADSGPQMDVDRSKMLPVHRMYADLENGADDSLGITQRRAAVVFGRYIRRVTRGEANEVDNSGQKLTANTQNVIEILQDDGLLDVREQSYPKIAARVMREVQRLTIIDEDHDCPDMDRCDHGVFEFRPGKPHSLAIGKERFAAYLSNLSDNDVRTADDAVNGKNTAEDGSVEDEFDRLKAAEQGEKYE